MKLPGIATGLAKSLGALAQKRKQSDVVSAHAANQFFCDYPGPSQFDELMKAARKAKVEEPVRAAALRFLETGVMPYQLIPTRPAAALVTPTKTPFKGRAGTSRMAKVISGTTSPPTPACVKVKIDPSWPLPMSDYLIPIVQRQS